MKHSARNVAISLILTCLCAIQAHSQMRMASLRPNPELHWQRTSPTPQQPDGPVLYQLLFSASGTPGTVPVFDTNPRHLADSPINIRSGHVVIGSGENRLTIDGSGVVTFAPGQTFPASDFPDLAGEVTGSPQATVVSNAVSANTANAVVRRDSSGNFSAGTISLSGNLALPNTASASVGVVTLGGTPFLHNFGAQNTFVGKSAGNLSMTGGDNTGVGLLALDNNTTGALNSAFGAAALANNTTGGGNSAFGPLALGANTAGTDNSAFGYLALQNSTASFNSAFGKGALQSNTSADYNSAFGFGALNSNTTGDSNAAFGHYALFNNTVGGFNAAFGGGALKANTTGVSNSAFGAAALFSTTTGSGNAAFGGDALSANTTGASNSAFGISAFNKLVSGNANIAMGDSAGSNLTAGDNNIYLSNAGVATESNTIRIGTTGNQTAAFIAGISGATSASGVNVFVNSAGQLGTATSSRRFKQGIADLGAESDVLMKLRPVAFYYKPELDSTHTRQYGLVAEEVAQIAPSLVVFDQDGKPQTVRYHFVNAMLLNEVQRQRRLIEQQQTELETVQSRLKQVMLRLAEIEKSVPATQLASAR